MLLFIPISVHSVTGKIWATFYFSNNVVYQVFVSDVDGGSLDQVCHHLLPLGRGRRQLPNVVHRIVASLYRKSRVAVNVVTFRGDVLL